MRMPSENLREEEQCLSRIFKDQMTPGLIILDPLMKIKQVNPALCQMLDFKEEELIGRSYLDLVHKSQVSQVLEKFWRQLHGERSIYETSLLTRTGQTLWVMVSAAPFMDEQAQIEGVFGFYTDLTEQKIAEEEVRFRANLLTNFRDCLLATDPQGQLVYANKGAAAILGWSQNELMTFKLEDLLTPEQGPLGTQVLKEVAQGKTWRGQMVVRHQEQSSRSLQFTWAPLWDEMQQIKGALGTAVDISDLVTARYQAEAAHQIKSELLSNMSHEIRTPLAGILGFTDLLQKEKFSPRISDFVTNIQRCGQQLSILINNILELSKIEADRISLQNSEFEVPILVQDCVATIQAQAEEADLELEIVISPQTPRVLKGDVGRLSQVITNLLGNALKFTPQGKISVLVSRCEHKPFSPTLFPLQIAVQDTGIGIPEAAQKDIFEAYTQVDELKPVRAGGAGLGLNISRRLVEFMGGEIWIESKAGKGSTFYFCVPLEIPIAKPGPQLFDPFPAPYPPDSTPPRIGTILVVEDNEANRRLLTYMLSDAGYTVKTAKNGVEALALLERAPVDLVLMDMQMPVLDGYATTRQIRAIEKWKDLPVVALTAHAMRGDVEKCLEAGCNTYLAKPFKHDRLLRLIQRILSPHKTTKRTQEEEKQKQLQQKLLPEFLVSLDQMLDQMQQALATADKAELLELTHGLKGSAGLYGLDVISTLGGQMYQALREEETDRLPQIYAQIKSEAQKARKVMESRRSNPD